MVRTQYCEVAGSRVAGEEGVVEEQHCNDSVLPKGVEDELASVFPGKLEMHQRTLGRIHANTYTVPTVSLLMYMMFICKFASQPCCKFVDSPSARGPQAIFPRI